MNRPTPETPAVPAVRSLTLHAQYLRDLSFESPQAPRGLQEARRSQPQVEMQLDLRAHPLDARAEDGQALAEKVWELILRLRLTARIEDDKGDTKTARPTDGATQTDTTDTQPTEPTEATGAKEETPAPLFIVELEYGGVLTPPEATEDEAARKVILTDGAHLLFPYVRKILADVTQEGGFQPVLLNPIDFQGLYHARLEAEAREAEAAQKASPPPSARNGTGANHH